MSGKLWTDDRKTAAKGVQKSPEHKRNISEAMKRRWEIRNKMEQI